MAKFLILAFFLVVIIWGAIIFWLANRNIIPKDVTGKKELEELRKQLVIKSATLENCKEKKKIQKQIEQIDAKIKNL